MTHALALQGVTKTFGTGHTAVTAVRDATLQVGEGEVVAIVGPSGSGKTTLLSIAGCLLRPTTGSVAILGREVAGLPESKRAAIRRRDIGFVFQSFNLLPALTAFENVLLAMNLAGHAGPTAADRAEELLAMLDLAHRTHATPGDMSGGEQQRLAVARALANRPALILADEPTASLDSRSGHRVMELMSKAVRGGAARSLVVVTHDTRILDAADRVLRMEDGVLSRA